jgi:hypothetical protein
LPQFRDFLNRFRPVGAPGAASRTGVPADRTAEVAAELDPVLALLAGTEAECARLIEAAERESNLIAGEASAQAAQILADGHARALVARGEAGARVIAAARAQVAEVERSATTRARAMRGPADDAVRALIAEAVRLVVAVAR